MPAPSDLPAELLTGPFTVSYAVSLGIPRSVLRGNRFRQPFRGVRVPAHLPDTLALRADAARLVLPTAAAFSHHTAAVLRDLPVTGDGRIHVTVPAPIARPKIREIVWHASSESGAVWFVEGRPLWAGTELPRARRSSAPRRTAGPRRCFGAAWLDDPRSTGQIFRALSSSLRYSTCPGDGATGQVTGRFSDGDENPAPSRVGRPTMP